MTAALRVLQRVVFPGEDLDVVPLYVETNPDRGAGDLAAEMLSGSLTGARADVSAIQVPSVAQSETQSVIRFGAVAPGHPVEEIRPRQTAAITEGRRVSFATYFNAFPAAYWRRWTTVEEVTLRIRLAGPATVMLYRSTARGHSHPVETIRTETDEPETIERRLPLQPFIDGGWYWFDIVAGPSGTTLIEADWLADAPDAPTGRFSVGITTFNRVRYVLDLVRSFGEAPEVLDRLDMIYVADQGTDHPADSPDFADATKKIADKLRIIQQPNIGGSGGFARGMDETARAGTSDYYLILDDDIQLDLEGIRRGITFADLARRPTIVGGNMFSMYDRAVMHAYGEVVAAHPWWWGHAPNTKPRHDFGRRNLRNTPWLHRRVDADYNGWWTCLVPVKVIREIGLSLPVFIKWDDAEYALRARKSGYPTVSLPGMAAWHVPWGDKNDAQDWQAYYHLRNRVIVALIHSPFKHGGALVYESAERQIQNLLSMQYSTAALRMLAIQDILSGPDHLHRELATKMAKLRELRGGYTDAQSASDLESFPPVRRRAPDLPPPASRIGLLSKVGRGIARQLRAPKPGAKVRPQVGLSHQDAHWWVLAKLDSALVSAPDGASAAWYQRDRKIFRRLAWRSFVLHVRLRQRWPKLAAQYRAAAPGFNSPERWRETFGITVAEAPGGQSTPEQ